MIRHGRFGRAPYTSEVSRPALLALLLLLACRAHAQPARGNRAERDRQALCEVLLGNDPVASRRAADRLGALGPAALDSVPALITALRRSDERLWDCSLAALAKIGPLAAPKLRGSLERSPRGARLRLAQVLVGFGPEIVPSLRDPRARVRRAALRALSWERTLPLSNAVELAVLGALLDADAENRDLARAILRGQVIDPDAAEVLPLLLECVRGVDPGVRCDATLYLRSHTPTPASLAALVYVLEEDLEEACRAEAARALGSLGPRAKRAPALSRALADASPQVRLAALKALGTLGECSPETLRALMGTLGDLDSAVGEQAPWTLVAVAPREHVGSLLASATRWTGWRTRAGAARTLSMLPQGVAPQRVEVLIAVLSDSASRVRIEGALGLRRLGPQGAPAAEALSRSLLDPSWEVRSAALSALEEFGPDAFPALDGLEAALGDVEPGLRQHAARILKGLGPAAAPKVEALSRTLGDSDLEVGCQAAQALAAIGPPAAPAVPELVAFARVPGHIDVSFGVLSGGDPQMDVRDALAAIGAAAVPEVLEQHRSSPVDNRGVTGALLRDLGLHLESQGTLVWWAIPSYYRNELTLLTVVLLFWFGGLSRVRRESPDSRHAWAFEVFSVAFFPTLLTCVAIAHACTRPWAQGFLPKPFLTQVPLTASAVLSCTGACLLASVWSCVAARRGHEPPTEAPFRARRPRPH